MSASLDTAKRKVQWAEKHFSDFKDIAFGRSTGLDTRHTTVAHYEFQRQPNSGPTQVLAPSIECRLAFGDAVHQLRSCLDHIVYALVKPLTNDRQALRKIDFPIYIDEDLFTKKSASVKHLRRFLTPYQFTEIIDTQPYKRNPVAPESEWLWVLSELDNIDKHRTVLVADPRILTKRRTADGIVRVVKHPLLPGAQGFTAPLPIPASQDEVDVDNPALVVVLAETGLRCDNITAVNVWREMVATVKGVIATFEPFF